MNVYVLQTALELARRGVEVEIFTRATSSADPPVVRVAPGVLVRNVVAGPFEGLDKYDLPTQLCAFTAGVLRAEATHEPGYYDIVHSHYWLSGSGRLAGPRPLGGAAGAHRAHPRRGQERRARRRRRAGAAAARGRRAAGGRRGRPADRQHRRRSAATGFAAPRRSRPHRRRAPRRRPADVHARRQAAGPRPRSGSAPTSRSWRSSAASSRSRRPTCCCARPPSCPDVRVVIAGGPSGSGLATPDGLVRLADELGITDRA